MAKKILLVDDANIIKLMLESSLGGYECWGLHRRGSVKNKELHPI